MKLDMFIRQKIIELSDKYDISLIEISKVKDGKYKKTYNFNYRPHESKAEENICERFYNKRELVSWLICLS